MTSTSYTGKIGFNMRNEPPRDKLVSLINHFGSQAFDCAQVRASAFVRPRPGSGASGYPVA